MIQKKYEQIAFIKKETVCEGKTANKEETAENKGNDPHFVDFSRGHCEIIATISKETCGNVKNAEVTQVPREIPY